MKKVIGILCSVFLIGSLQAEPIMYQKNFYKKDFKIEQNAKVALASFLFQEIDKWEVEGDNYSYTYRFLLSNKNQKRIDEILIGDKGSIRKILIDAKSVAESDYVQEEAYTKETLLNFINLYQLPFGTFLGRRSRVIADIATEVNSNYFYVVRFNYSITATAVEYMFIAKLYDKEGNLLYNRMLQDKGEPPTQVDILEQSTAEAYTQNLLNGFRSLNQQFWQEIVNYK